MSTFKVEIVPVSLRPHPNADTLSLVTVHGFTAIVRTEEWTGRDRGAYIPVDAVVPDRPEFAFLDGTRRIKARRLRGVFSMGLLVRAPDGAEIGDDVTAAMGVEKYVSPSEQETSTGGEDVPAPSGIAPVYTDIESLRRYVAVLAPGEDVIATEKIHGANMRATLRDGVLHVGSRTRWKRDDPKSIWWRAARASDIEARMQRLPPGCVVYGEAYGQVQDLRYGAGAGECRFRAFDLFDPERGAYVDWTHARAMLLAVGFEVAPERYCGPFDFAALKALAESDSVIEPGQIMEGLVIRPARERFDETIGRVILKLHSQRYLLRKGA